MKHRSKLILVLAFALFSLLSVQAAYAQGPGNLAAPQLQETATVEATETVTTTATITATETATATIEATGTVEATSTPMATVETTATMESTMTPMATADATMEATATTVAPQTMPQTGAVDTGNGMNSLAPVLIITGLGILSAAYIFRRNR